MERVEIRKTKVGWDYRIVEDEKIKFEVTRVEEFINGEYIYFINGVERRERKLTDKEKELLKKIEEEIEKSQK